MNQNNNEVDSLKQEVKTCYNDSYERIQELAKKVDQVETSLTNLVHETKSSLESQISNVESGLTTRFISIQNQVSDLNTNINNVQVSLEKLESSSDAEFTKVWAKFKEVEKEIANLPKNCGNGMYNYIRNYVILYIIFYLL